GFEASWVMDAEQAARRLSDDDFDVLLADCRLPGLGGVELARAARLSRPDMGIAVMTSYPEAGIETAARVNGVDDFFEKPLHSHNFIARIKTLVSRSRAARMRGAGTPPARGATARVEPVELAQEVPARDGISGPLN